MKVISSKQVGFRSSFFDCKLSCGHMAVATRRTCKETGRYIAPKTCKCHTCKK